MQECTLHLSPVSCLFLHDVDACFSELLQWPFYTTSKSVEHKIFTHGVRGKALDGIFQERLCINSTVVTDWDRERERDGGRDEEMEGGEGRDWRGVMSSHSDSSISALSPCARQQSLGTGPDSASLASLTVRMLTVRLRCWSIFPKRSSRVWWPTSKTKVPALWNNGEVAGGKGTFSIQAFCSWDARKGVKKRMDTGHQRRIR